MAVCTCYLFRLREQRRRGEATHELTSASEEAAEAIGSRGAPVGRARARGATRRPESPDDVLEVVVDLGEDHVLKIPKRTIKSAEMLFVAIAKATSKRLGKRTPRAWQKASSGGGRSDVAASMSVTLTFDNQVDDPTSEVLASDTSVERIREATSVLVMPT